MRETVPHPFSLRQWQYALAVADSLNFRQASELCHVAQPSLSAQIAKLEADLGVQLFERDRQHVLVTPAGRLLLDRARLLLQSADDLARAAVTGADPFHGTMHIGVIPTISPYLLPQLTAPLRKAYPDLKLFWIEEKTSVLIGKLNQGELDAAILALESQTLESHLGEFSYQTLARDHFVLAAPRHVPLGKDLSLLTLRELRGAEILLLEEGHCLNEQIGGLCSRVRATQAEFRATSLPTLVQMVSGGAGITLLPELAVPTETRRARLALRPFADPKPYRTIIFLRRKSSAIGKALEEMGELLGTEYPNSA